MDGDFVDIIGYEGKYQINKMGAIKSLCRNGAKEKILKSNSSTGYFRCALAKNGITKSYNIHRLVAIQFLPNPDNLPSVDHKNRIKTDNNIENLRWVSQSENMYNQQLKGCVCKTKDKSNGKTYEYFRAHYYTREGRKSKRFKTEQEAEAFLKIAVEYEQEKRDASI